MKLSSLNPLPFLKTKATSKTYRLAFVAIVGLLVAWGVLPAGSGDVFIDLLVNLLTGP
jgi:hypothetical protein